MRHAILLFTIPAFAVNVWTDHYDNSRQGWNQQETALTSSNVASKKFAKLGSFAVDGAVRGQPLIVNGSLIVTTMHNSVYAFDSTLPNSAAVWHAGPLGTARTSWPGSGAGDNVAYSGGELGIISTPVIDVANGAIYAVVQTSAPAAVLYKLNLSTGATISSVTISATGFDASHELQRAALTLANGNVYLAFASFNDSGTWHGWVIGYDSTLTQVGALNITPGGSGGGIWHSGGGLAVDSSGNIYAGTGNGDYDGVTKFGSSIIKLSPTLSILDWWTPSNWATLNANDQDISSGRVMTIGSLAVSGGKDYRVFSVLQACMGHLQGGGSSCTAAQVFPTGAGSGDHGIYGGMFAGTTGYFPNDGAMYAFSLSGSTWNITPTVSAGTYSYPGAQCSLSSNGSSNSILWCVTDAANSETVPRPGTLRALNPATLAEMWSSDTDMSGVDSLGTLSKFSAPMVADGRVYVPTLDNAVKVYGLVVSGGMRGNAVIRGGSVVR